MSLRAYHGKRDFDRSPEPAGKLDAGPDGNLFVVQHHMARREHYDLRLELGGVLKSWAVPKGPSLDPREKRLAVEVEDHPLEYGSFEGVIPKGEYGGGTVMLWDRGTWTPAEKNPAKAIAKGKIRFTLEGQKMRGGWSLVRMGKKPGERANNWLLIKSRDAEANASDGEALVREKTLSAASGRSMAQIAKSPGRVWTRSGEAAVGDPDDPPGDIDELTASLRGAKRGEAPAAMSPQLAVTRTDPPRGGGWVHEIKLDGYRLVMHVGGGKLRAVSRNGRDWTDRLRKDLRDALASLPIDGAILDGELVALDEHGRSSFQRLQRAFKERVRTPLHFIAFDLPWCAGYDLTGCTLLDRKRVLRTVVDAGASDLVRFSEHLDVPGERMLARACELGVEGIVSKRADARYVTRRTSDWVKVKCVKRQEFAVVGYTPPAGSRTALGALLLAVRENGSARSPRYRYCGKVGAGFSERSLRELRRRLDGDAIAKPAVIDPPRGAAVRGATWVRPRLAAEVRFAEWTDEGSLRHPVFLGVREDKSAAEAVREPVAAATSPVKRTTVPRRRGKDDEAEVAGVRLSNPDRVLFPEIGLTKRRLAEYYASIAAWVLPWVVDRPLTLVRCPKGRGGACFYQKHFNETMPPGVAAVTVREDKGEGRYVTVGDLSGVIGLVQIGVLEMHPWASRVDDHDRPDMMVFDLDPGEGVTMGRLRDAAREVRDELGSLGFETFVRTTGGKGLHVVAPLRAEAGFDTVKAFAREVASAMAARAPKRYVAVMTKAKRVGKVFIDYLRNGRGATAVASYSTRARPGAPVATPLRWDELSRVGASAAYGVANVPRRLASIGGDPWAGFDAARRAVDPGILEAIKR